MNLSYWIIPKNSLNFKSKNSLCFIATQDRKLFYIADFFTEFIPTLEYKYSIPIHNNIPKQHKKCNTRTYSRSFL